MALLELKRRRHSMYSPGHILKIPAETKTAEVVSVSLSQARVDTRAHIDGFPTGDELSQSFFVGRDNTYAEGNDEGVVPFTSAVENNVYTEYFPEAAMVVGKGQNLYSRNMIADEHRDERRIAGPFYPFSGKEDRNTCTFKWLISLQVPTEKLDECFELPYYVCHFLLHLSMNPY